MIYKPNKEVFEDYPPIDFKKYDRNSPCGEKLLKGFIFMILIIPYSLLLSLIFNLSMAINLIGGRDLKGGR